ncbi:MAG: SxtJ family membrane protein, partial [Flavobacteriaceae bacterium]|nr:SxtJ family membrane protein [Flavobacteriaceae bacterium]
PWIIAGILWVWALLLPSTLNLVYRGWMAIGHVLGWINTRIILGIMFYIIFLPVGLLLKLAGKDPMARTITKSQNTYRVIHPVPKKNHVERPY